METARASETPVTTSDKKPYLPAPVITADLITHRHLRRVTIINTHMLVSIAP